MNDKEYNQQVAETTLSQLGGSGRLKAMINAKNFGQLNGDLSFKFSGKKFNYIKIHLNGNDLYDITFMKLVKYDIRKEETVKDIYCDQMKEIIENKIEMYLSL